MHIAEVVTIAKSLPLLRLNTYKSLILSYSSDYRRIFSKNYPIFATYTNPNPFIMKKVLLIVAAILLANAVSASAPD